MPVQRIEDPQDFFGDLMHNGALPDAPPACAELLQLPLSAVREEAGKLLARCPTGPWVCWVLVWGSVALFANEGSPQHPSMRTAPFARLPSCRNPPPCPVTQAKPKSQQWPGPRVRGAS